MSESIKISDIVALADFFLEANAPSPDDYQNIIIIRNDVHSIARNEIKDSSRIAVICNALMVSIEYLLHYDGFSNPNKVRELYNKLKNSLQITALDKSVLRSSL